MRGRGLLIGAAALALLANVNTGAMAVPAAIPAAALPDRTWGPIAVTPTSHPLLAAAFQEVPVDLDAAGYVEQEYFFSGRANVYRYGPDRALEVQSAAAPYTNRFILRIPRDRGRFNGRVVVELLNPTGAIDLAVLWNASNAYLMDQGYAYVGLTPKPVNVVALKAFDPGRYAPLSWTNPAPADQACIAAHPVGALTAHSVVETEDGLVWDMISQLAALLRSDRADNPLRAYRPQYLYASGYSQTASYVGTYIKEFQPRVTIGGKAPFDGFLPGGTSGLNRLNQCQPTIPDTDPYSDVASSQPVVRVMTLSDFLRIGPFGAFHHRREDSDAPDDRFRLYEVAGASHTDVATRLNAPAASETAHFRPPYAPNCVEPTRSYFPLGVALDTALRHLDNWASRGIVPPRAPRLTISQPESRLSEPAVDQFGNALGGMRTPAVDVPVATYLGRSTERDPGRVTACSYEGNTTPFSDALLRQLYPSHADYVAKVRASVASLARAGWLTAFDAGRLIRQAERMPMPPKAGLDEALLTEK